MTDVFLARQPIFDRDLKVHAYELLYRASVNNYCPPDDLAHASYRIISNVSMSMNLFNLTAGKKAFINITREILLDEFVDLLPSDSVVVELLETVEPDPEVITACKRLKDLGYTLALDDYVDSPRYQPLLELADIVKVDLLATTPEEQEVLARIPLKYKNIKLLAEKVETHEALQRTRRMGYQYFQGYFFCRPVVFVGKELPGLKLQYLRLLQKVQKPNIDWFELESIIKTDVSLSFKLLRYVNSTFFTRTSEVTSIRRALIVLGERETRKWVSLMILAKLADGKLDELITQSVVRARLCETLGRTAGLSTRSEDLFLLGLFSLVDAMLDSDVERVVTELHLAGDLRNVLLGESKPGDPFHDVFSCVLAYERGDWESLKAALIGETAIELSPQYYLGAIKWTNEHQAFI
jgi:c-di-GMP-related signal transduction protein